MTSDRSYREALPKEEALEIMKSESAIKWDPDVVNALFEVIEG
jgi:HD-GYP domain-containing protein (c-di-GMP phosphodiesterase class II)